MEVRYLTSMCEALDVMSNPGKKEKEEREEREKGREERE